MSTPEQRLRALERALRRQRLIGAILVVPVIALPVIGAADLTLVQDLVKTKQLEIVNDAGQTVVRLTSDPDGGLVNVADKNGVTFLSLTTDADGGMLILHNNRETPVLALYADADGGAVQVRSREGDRVGLLASDPQGRGLINLSNEAENAVVVIGADRDGGLIELRNKAAGPVFLAAAGATGEGLVAVHDAEGQRLWGAP